MARHNDCPGLRVRTAQATDASGYTSCRLGSMFGAMSEPNVLVSFRLDRTQPLRLRWLATDGAPGTGYKAQITAIKLMDGSRLAMHSSAILEQTAADPEGGVDAYTLTFNGMVGFGADHPDRGTIDQLVDQDVDYELEFVHDESGRTAVEDTDFRIVERPRGVARKVSKPT
jgi:hypothetical protein